jgi:phosphatidate cytidylyltransferase
LDAAPLLRTRLLTAALLIPVVVGAIWIGEYAFFALIVLLLSLAEVEFSQLGRAIGYRPAVGFGLALVWVLLLDARLPGLGLAGPGIAFVLLGSLSWQIAHREGSPVGDWSVAIASGLYLGVCGSCLLRLRDLSPDGLWWTFTVVPSIMAADSGAYFVGKAWGRRKLAPTLSPGKTWEGYLAGIATGGALTCFLGWLWPRVSGLDMRLSPLHGLAVGLIVATIAPLGDLAVSMIKRSASAKDSGSIIPGHGGALDRVDSVLWAAVLGYYYVLWFVI